MRVTYRFWCRESSMVSLNVFSINLLDRGIDAFNMENAKFRKRCRAASQSASQPAGRSLPCLIRTFVLTQNFVCQSNVRPCQMCVRAFVCKMNELISAATSSQFNFAGVRSHIHVFYAKMRHTQKERKKKFSVSFVGSSFRKPANNLNSYLCKTFPLMR